MILNNSQHPHSDPQFDLRTSLLPRLYVLNEREPNLDRAFILGAYQGASKRGGSQQQVNFQSQDRTVLECIRETLYKLGFNPLIQNVSCSGDTTSFMLAISSSRLSEYLSDLCCNNTLIPFELLATKDEQISFLSGLLSVTGGFSNRHFMIESAHHHGLITYVACLFAELGIYPTVMRSQNKSICQISAIEDLKRLHALNILIGVKQNKLTSLLTKTGESLSSISPETYYTAIGMRGSKSASCVADSLNISQGLVASWYRGVTPRVIQRIDDINDIRLKHKIPNIQALALCFRHFKFSRDLSLHLSTRHNLELLTAHLPAIVEFLSRSASDKITDTQLLQLIERKISGRALSLCGLTK